MHYCLCTVDRTCFVPGSVVELLWRQAWCRGVFKRVDGTLCSVSVEDDRDVDVQLGVAVDRVRLPCSGPSSMALATTSMVTRPNTTGSVCTGGSAAEVVVRRKCPASEQGASVPVPGVLGWGNGVLTDATAQRTAPGKCHAVPHQ
jgi:hypothetical protein